MLFSILIALVVGTWNGNWFPSGRAEHRAAPEIEEVTTKVAAKRLCNGIRRVDPSGNEDVVICLNEMRNLEAVSNLVARMGVSNLTVAAISGYRRRDRFDGQQDAILTTLPVISSSWSNWKRQGKVVPPRGYAHARLRLADGRTLDVYSTHLKSNYGATTATVREQNVAKRTASARQLVTNTRPGRGKGKEVLTLIAGDMNADKWAKGGEEPLFAMLSEAGYANVFDSVPPASRGTHPSKTWGDSCLDYVFTRGFGIAAGPLTESCEGVSDHNAVFVRITPLRKTP